MMKNTLISAAILFWAAAAFADSSLDANVVAEASRRMGVSPEKVRDLALHGCDSANTREMAGCTNYWFISQDYEMNNYFGQMMADRKGKRRRDLLLKAQRAWLQYRDATCDFEASGYLGGSQADVERFHCMSTLTEARNAQLGNYSTCSADVGCP